MGGLLPIDSLLPEIKSLVTPGSNLVIEAAPGAGKTTRVPPALLADAGSVIVLEPRRIAARMAARRVAQDVGDVVAYQVRFEDTTSSKTRLTFATEGVLTRRLITHKDLRGVSTVILDEFHERHIETDLALAMLRRLQKSTRPDLSIVVMSATLNPEPVSRFLGGCPMVKSEGRMFELRVEHTPYSAATQEAQIASAVERLVREEKQGDILVFLPGSGEIRKAARELDGFARRNDLMIAPLNGDLSPAEQDFAVAPASKRKVILATNIAESSVTIEGVNAVIDTGLARIAIDSPWTGLPSLEVKRISKASAKQRAGRAGRTGPGRVIRLYTTEDFHRRPDHDVPELLRRELSGLCLQLRAAGVQHPNEIEWLDAPAVEAIDAAEALLERLDASAEMARMPVHPRLARLLMNGGDKGARVAALLSSGQRVNSIDDAPDERTQKVYRQLRRYAKGTGDIDKAVLAAFPDRVEKRAPNDFVVLIDPPWLSHPIKPDWLLDLFPDRIKEVNTVEWNRQAERVEAVSALLYDDVVIEESRGGRGDEEAAAALLSKKVMEAGIGRFIDAAELDEFLARAEFAGASVDVDQTMKELCLGLRSFSEVEKAMASLIPALEAKVGTAQLERLAPSRMKLMAGRSVKVRYERGKPPWVASRLQDFFGMKETPKIAGGKVALVVHLLAPNQRPVQMTTDLAGFWERLYPQLRRELGRRYPRHSWPENPV